MSKILARDRRSGFTLIELLVVTAIIALIATVVIAALTSARLKGEDKSVAANLRTVLNQSELFSADNNNSFLPPGGTVFGIATCPAYDPAGGNMLARDRIVNDAIKEATLRGNGNSCYNSGNAWAVAVGLKGSPNTSWCVDNAENYRQVSFAPGAAIDPATFTCK